MPPAPSPAHPRRRGQGWGGNGLWAASLGPHTLLSNRYFAFGQLLIGKVNVSQKISIAQEKCVETSASQQSVVSVPVCTLVSRSLVSLLCF